MLTCASVSNDAGFSHAPGEKNLADGVIDFMSPRVQQILPLKVDFGATEFLRETLRKIQRRGPSAEIAQKAGEFFSEFRIFSGGVVFPLEILQGSHQGLGNKHPAIFAKVSAGIRQHLF